MTSLAEFVKNRRKSTGISQQQLAERAGVALTIIRKIEQGKTNLNLDKVNLVLKMFGHELVPVSSKELGRLGKETFITERTWQVRSRNRMKESIFSGTMKNMSESTLQNSFRSPFRLRINHTLKKDCFLFSRG